MLFLLKLSRSLGRIDFDVMIKNHNNKIKYENVANNSRSKEVHSGSILLLLRDIRCLDRYIRVYEL